jgi:hypothetical protein
LSLKCGQYASFPFTTRNPSTGAAQNADAPPTGVVLVRGLRSPKVTFNGTGAFTVSYSTSVTVLNTGTGQYLASYAVPEGATRDSVSVRMTGTVNSVSDSQDYFQGVIDAAADEVRADLSVVKNFLLGDKFIDPATSPFRLKTYEPRSGQPGAGLPITSQPVYDISLAGITDTLTIVASQWGLGPFTGPEFHWDAVNGNDANDGLTAATAWQTWAKVKAAILAGTIAPGSWVDEKGASRDIGDLADIVDKDAWFFNQLLAGKLSHTGGQVVIHGTVTVTSTVTAQGIVFRSATPRPATINQLIPLPTGTWSQPNAGSYPHVYKFSGTMTMGMIQQAGAQLVPPNGQSGAVYASTAAALAAMVQGSITADPADGKILVWLWRNEVPATTTDPLTYSASLNGQIDGTLIEMSGGVAYNLNCTGGYIYDHLGVNTGFASPVTQCVFGATTLTKITVFWGLTIGDFGKHGLLVAGADSANGILARLFLAFTRGPAGVNFGNWSADVDFTSATTVGTTASYFFGCTSVGGVANANGTAGGTDLADSATGFYPAFICHNAGGTNYQFLMRRFGRCHYRGSVGFGAGETAQTTADDCRFDGSFVGDVPLAVVRNCAVGFALPSIGQFITGGYYRFDRTAFNPNVTTPFSNARYLGATVDCTGCAFNLPTSGGNSTVWRRSTGFAVTIWGGSYHGPTVQNFSLFESLGLSDSFLLRGVAITGSATTDAIIASYNSGAAKTWQGVHDAGWTDGNCTFNGALAF